LACLYSFLIVSISSILNISDTRIFAFIISLLALYFFMFVSPTFQSIFHLGLGSSPD
jgi:hypothetical protein